jgi:hypothetical protein
MSGGNQRRRGGRNQNAKQGNTQKKATANGQKRKNRSRSRSKKVDPRKYWGDRELLAIPESFAIDTPDTSVVATSLGRPPIPGQENASKHYFSLVYDRAAMLAGALAAAGDLQNMATNAAALEEELRARDLELDGYDEPDDDEANEDDDNDNDDEDGVDPDEDTDGNRPAGAATAGDSDDLNPEDDEA